MFKYIISFITGLFIVCSAWCETIQFTFQSEGNIRHGNIVCPKGKDKKTIFIYVNHRMSRSEENFKYYSELTEKLLDEGISCCYYDNRPPVQEDSIALPTTLFDMADDAVAVYRSLKTIKRFEQYKIGFYGTSEAGSSALIAASMVPNPAFLVQQSTCVIPQIEEDFLKYTVYQMNLTAMFTNPKFLGMPYYRYATMMREINEKLKDNQVDDTKAYAQTIIKKYFSDFSEDKKEICNRMLPELIYDMANKLGIADRLIWNARPYYQNVKCPILYISGFRDINVFCFPSLVEFEKIMLENGHKRFNTVVVDMNHQMLTTQEVFEQRYRNKEPKGIKKQLVWDFINKWIVETIL